MYDYYKLVPKDLEANIAWRKKVIRDAAASESAQHDLWTACARDPLFYVNAFGWTYDPRPATGKPRTVPFLTYPFQDRLMMTLMGAIGDHDLCILKSRDMGVSWLSLVAFVWQCHFRSGLAFGLVSRNADYVDKPGNPKALFWKVDFFLDRLPGWLRGRWERSKMHTACDATGSMMDGESTTGEVAVGNRLTSLFIDEFSKFEAGDGYRVLTGSQAATNSRIFNGTPEGTTGAYADVARGEHCEGIERVTVHWSQHPVKNKGLYTSQDGALQIKDATYSFPPSYKFILDGKLRSVVYDAEERRAPLPFTMAQEWDISFEGSECSFWHGQWALELDRAEREDCVPPLLIGELEYDTASMMPSDFIPVASGRLRIWQALVEDAQGRKRPAADHKYSIGIDVSSGSGASNSTISIVDRVTCEKVAEWVSATTRTDEFAKQSIALARWYNDALIVWEANGPGNYFGAKLIEFGYRNIYYRRNEKSLIRRSTEFPGFWSNVDTKRVLLEAYRSALGKVLKNRSKPAIKECREYIYLPNGNVVHSRARSTMDPSGANDNHGDRVIADALAWRGVEERPAKIDAPRAAIPVGSFEWRRKRREREESDCRRHMVFA